MKLYQTVKHWYFARSSDQKFWCIAGRLGTLSQKVLNHEEFRGEFRWEKVSFKYFGIESSHFSYSNIYTREKYWLSIHLSIDNKTTLTYLVNPFHTAGLFLYPLKISENLSFSDVFSGHRKGPVAWNGLKWVVNKTKN